MQTENFVRLLARIMTGLKLRRVAAVRIRLPKEIGCVGNVGKANLKALALPSPLLIHSRVTLLLTDADFSGSEDLTVILVRANPL